MSVTGKRGVGIPIILLHDAEGGQVTVELKNGCIYRGLLDEAQDNMNCTMKNCIKTSSDGRDSMIEIVYIRGSQIAFIKLPDTLSKAPFFNRIKMWRKFSGHAVYGANTAMIEAIGGRGGRGRGGRGVFPGRGGRMGDGGGRFGDGGGRMGDGGGRGQMLHQHPYHGGGGPGMPFPAGGGSGNMMPYPGNYGPPPNNYGPPHNYR